MGRGVAALSLQQRQRSDFNMSSYNWRDTDICKLLTVMGGKVMQSHLTKTGRECDLRENTRRTFLTMLGQQSGQPNKEYVVDFALVNSESRFSLHSDVNLFLHARMSESKEKRHSEYAIY